MEELKYNQSEMLELINQYNQTDRKLIKQNLRHILTTHNIKPKHIIQLGFARPNVYAWMAPTTNNIPLINQALTIACAFDFSIEEFLVN